MASHHRSNKGSSEPPPYVHRGQRSAYDNHPYQPQYGGYHGSPHGNQVSPYSQAPVVAQPGVTNNTIIVNSGGQQQQQQRRGPRNWSSGVCSCCADMGICCFVCFCPCIHACKLSSDMDESCCVPCCVPGWLIALRTQMRAKENIQGSLMDDCCTVCFCCPCTLCQLAREVRYVKNVR